MMMVVVDILPVATPGPHQEVLLHHATNHIDRLLTSRHPMFGNLSNGAP